MHFSKSEYRSSQPHVDGWCRYDEIRDLYAGKLASVWMEDSTAESIRTNIKNKIKNFVEGGLDHAAEIVAALWKIASSDGNAPAPANGSSKVSSS